LSEHPNDWIADDRRLNFDSTIIIFPDGAVGYYEIDGRYRLCMEKRPSWLARLMARWLLEFHWRDNP
jgi:hypothetical protein